jgi:hypothetical protein
MAKYTPEQKLKELKQELAMRQSAYPRWIISGKITALLAKERIKILEDIIQDYQDKIYTGKEIPKTQQNLFGGYQPDDKLDTSNPPS